MYKSREKTCPGRITLFGATELGAGIDHDPQMGWGGLAGAGLETHLIPGYHAHIVLEPRVRLLAKQLTAALWRAQEVQETPTHCEEGQSQTRKVSASLT